MLILKWKKWLLSTQILMETLHFQNIFKIRIIYTKEISNTKDLILLISSYLDDDYNEELEEVIDHLSEIHYYNEVNK